MSLPLNDMFTLLRKGLGGLDIQDLSDEIATLYLNMSFWELTAKYPFEEKKFRYDFNTVAGAKSYSLAAAARLESIESIAIEDQTSKAREKLSRMSRDWYDSQNDGEEGRPRHYMRENGCLFLYPTPDAVYNIEFLGITGVVSLKLGSVEATGLPRNWDELIIEGAITRGHFYNEDYDLARQAENFKVAKLRTTLSDEVKKDKDSSHAGLNVAWSEEDLRG